MKRIISDDILEQLEFKTLQDSDKTSKMDWLFPDDESNSTIGNSVENNVLFLKKISQPSYCYLFPIQIGKKKIFLLYDLINQYIVGYFGNENFIDNPEEHLLTSFKKLIELKNIKMTLLVFSDSKILKMENFVYSINRFLFFNLSRMKSLEFFLEITLDQLQKSIESLVKAFVVVSLGPNNKDFLKNPDDYWKKDNTQENNANYQNLFLEICNEEEILSSITNALQMMNRQIAKGDLDIKKISRRRNTFDHMVSDILQKSLDERLEVHEIEPAEDKENKT